MAGRFDFPIDTAFDANGDPISGAKLYFYETGTSTPQDTYSDDALSSANTNPVIADSAGRFGDIFLTGADYKVTLTDASDVTIWTADPVRSPAELSTVVLTKTTTYTVSVDDEGKLISGDATSGGFTITLPVAATAGNGFEVTIMKTDSSSNVVTVDGNGSETINGNSDASLSEQYAATVFRTDGTTWLAYAITETTTTRVLPPSHIDGLTLSNNSTDADHDVDIAAGSARDGDDGGNITLSSALVKRLDSAFAEGTNQGGLDTGTIAADTPYHMWAIGKTDGTADVLFSTSNSSPTMPSGFTLKRRIGEVLTDSSSNIIGDQISQVVLGGEQGFVRPTVGTGASFVVAENLTGVDMIEISFRDLSPSAANTILELVLGTSGGFITTGYEGEVSGLNAGAGASANFSSEFQLTNNNQYDAANAVAGKVVLSHMGSNLWSMTSQAHDNGIVHLSDGELDLGSDELTQLRMEVSTGVFDGGTVRVRIERR